ncbi:hypothetical protein BC939DRAFT_457280 [Gamsiella multidivaricata]|uniref:uncharacterized protein n=1 Tax=Gamsiella multidivaricata TaxID=101098 RepID=UPI00221E7B44|nr:uncharacterized protein BC939DRAFT_457280 [Gamsiella multidivaricata]KAI7820653.1 hypothetical protein BC939DRAFT_457280 [Gamsiella multidivaricata]
MQPQGESSQITDFEQSSSQATVVERGKKRKNSAVVQEQATDGYDGQQGNTKRAARSPSKMYSSKAQAIETQTTQPALESREPMVAASSANLTLNEAIGSSESMDKKEDEDDINDFESSTPQRMLRPQRSYGSTKRRTLVTIPIGNSGVGEASDRGKGRGSGRRTSRSKI